MCTVLGYCSSKVSEETCQDLLSVASSRGPDMTRTLRVPGGILGFDRLSIMGLSEAGMQPFIRNLFGIIIFIPVRSMGFVKP